MKPRFQIFQGWAFSLPHFVEEVPEEFGQELNPKLVEFRIWKGCGSSQKGRVSRVKKQKLGVITCLRFVG
jgi:hypothetical protein